MKNYSLVPQERVDYCLCSVLQAILKSHNISTSQRDIADNLTPSDKGFLAHDDRIKAFLRSRGFNYDFYWYNETPFNEPDMILRDMQDNDGIIGIGQHTYLMAGFNDPSIKLIDPGDNAIIKRDIYELLKEMKSHEGLFGLIKKL